MSEGETASGQGTALVFDASVLIDLCEGDRELLGLMADTLGPVVVPTPVLGEVAGLDDAGCRGFGLQLLEPTIDQMSEAASGAGALSFCDWLCLIVARDGGWTCVTNDAALLRTCQEQGVSAMRGLRSVLMLVESGVIDRRRAMTFVQVLRQVNPHIKPGVVTAFARELRMAIRKGQR
jgi:predicted nucleic acid-binding protein